MAGKTLICASIGLIGGALLSIGVGGNSASAAPNAPSQCGLKTKLIASNSAKAAANAKATDFHKKVAQALARNASASDFAKILQAAGEDIDPSTAAWVKVAVPGERLDDTNTTKTSHILGLGYTNAAKTHYGVMMMPEFRGYEPPGGIDHLPTLEEALGPPPQRPEPPPPAPLSPALRAITKMVLGGCTPQDVATAMQAYDVLVPPDVPRPPALDLSGAHYFRIPYDPPIVGLVIPFSSGSGQMRVPVAGTEAYNGLEGLPSQQEISFKPQP